MLDNGSWDSLSGETGDMQVRGWISVLLWAVPAVLSWPAAAQTAAQGKRVVYDAAFFQAFSPSDALQIVMRVPGFKLEEADSEVRGFRQAAGNVVINGQRPSLKSETLAQVLARIPASRVLRVEVAPGEQFGSDYAGKTQVANIVLSDAGGLAGTLEATLRREFTGALLPEGSASALVRHGPSTFNAALKLENSATSEIGYDRVTDLPSGALREFRRKINRIKDPIGTASAGWSLEEGDNRSAHLNASLAIERDRLTQANHVIPQGAPERDDSLYQRYFRRTIELGGDVTRPLLGGGIKLLGLATRRYRDRDDSAFQEDAGALLQNQLDWREESLARLSWSREKLAGWSVELGAEGAFNRLRSIVDLQAVDMAGDATRIDLPIDDAVVREYRGEAFAKAGRDLSRTVHLDLSLGYEASRVRVSGDARVRRSLQFFKPGAALDWWPAGWHVRLSGQRTVSQLNFDDFVSFAELVNDRVNGGNANLQPQRAWDLLASVDRAVLGDGRLKLEIGYSVIGKVVDRIPTPDGFDAPGNLGNGSEFSLVGNLDLPLARLGIKGGRLSLYGSYSDTSVRDPYTGLDRSFSGYSGFFFTTEFRQDLGRFAWGLSAEGGTIAATYRRDELYRYQRVSPYLRGFVEYRPDARWVFTMGVDNPIDGHFKEFRDFFTPDRTSARPDLNEFRYRTRHVVGYLTIKRRFD